MTCNDSDKVDTNQLMQDITNVDYIPSVTLKLQDYRKHKNLNKNSIISMMKGPNPDSSS